MEETLTKKPTLAAVLLGILGAFNLINGIMMLDTAGDLAVLTMNTSLETLGWVALIFGAAQMMASVLLHIEKGGEILGTVVASLAILFYMLVFMWVPLAAVVAIALNTLVLVSIAGSTEGSADSVKES